MKLTARDLKVIASTAVITSLIFIGYNIFFKETTALGIVQSKTAEPFVSEKISWKDAIILKDEYEAFTPLRVWNTATRQFEKLKGFKFKADHLREVLNDNVIGGSDVDEVIFYLGKKGRTSQDGRSYENIHVIAAGMKAGRLLIPASAGDQADARKSSVFDKADPCPGPGCP